MKRFDKNFKIEAVRLVLEQGRSASSVAKELDIHENTVRKWIKEYKIHSDDAFPGSGNLKPQDEEIRQLKKRIADLEEENAILKKATAIFARHQK